MTIIEVKGLVKRYGAQMAVDDISFTVERGEIFGIIGPNGAGKTTTVECIEGLRRPDQGSVRVLGWDPFRDTAALRQCLGVQLQESELPEKLRVHEALRLYRSFYARPADPNRLIAAVGLADKRDTGYGQLSGGQKQRLSIALALIGNPEVVVLDELTTGLDPSGRREIWDLIKEIRAGGVTVILITHFMDEAQHLCDRLALFLGGRIVAIDTASGLISRARVQQRLRFRATPTRCDQILLDLAEVDDLRRHGDEVCVTGRGDLASAVLAALANQNLPTEDLRIESGTLDDAFIALTRRPGVA